MWRKSTLTLTLTLTLRLPLTQDRHSFNQQAANKRRMSDLVPSRGATGLLEEPPLSLHYIHTHQSDTLKPAHSTVVENGVDLALLSLPPCDSDHSSTSSTGAREGQHELTPTVVVREATPHPHHDISNADEVRAHPHVSVPSLSVSE